MSKEQRYKIEIDYDEADFVNLNYDEADDVAADLYLDEYMGNFKIEEDEDKGLVLTGEFVESAIEEQGSIASAIRTIVEENEFILSITKSDID